jgi:hypothetical protein
MLPETAPDKGRDKQRQQEETMAQTTPREPRA